MIIERKGDVLAVERGIIVHGTNCQGVMASGVAKQVRERYPAAYTEYKSEFDNYGLALGRITSVRVGMHKWIVNANTQARYGKERNRYVSYDAIALCFEAVTALANAQGLPVVFPKIGAGLGGGDWEIIKVIIDRTVPDSIEKAVYTP